MNNENAWIILCIAVMAFIVNAHLQLWTEPTLFDFTGGMIAAVVVAKTFDFMDRKRGIK